MVKILQAVNGDKDAIPPAGTSGVRGTEAVPGSGKVSPDLTGAFEKLQTATPEGLRAEGKTHEGIGKAIDRMLGITEEEFQKWRDGDIPDNPRFAAAEKYAGDPHHAVIGFDDREANTLLKKIRSEVSEKDYPPVKPGLEPTKATPQELRTHQHIDHYSANERDATVEEQATLAREMAAAKDYRLTEARRIGIAPKSLQDYSSKTRMGGGGVAVNLNREFPGLVRKGGQSFDSLAADLGFESADDFHKYLTEQKSHVEAKRESNALRETQKRRDNIIQMGGRVAGARRTLSGYFDDDVISTVKHAGKETAGQKSVREVAKALGHDVSYWKSDQDAPQSTTLTPDEEPPAFPKAGDGPRSERNP
jgi:hypothetical protein